LAGLIAVCKGDYTQEQKKDEKWKKKNKVRGMALALLLTRVVVQ
jgi:hypothetical protein